MAVRLRDLLAVRAQTQYSRQWEVDGSNPAKDPYIVSERVFSQHRTEFYCGCKGWTTTFPRQDCKHILQVKLRLIEDIARQERGYGYAAAGGGCPRCDYAVCQCSSPDPCPNCGGEGPLGRFVKTGQSGFGDVEGYTCTHEYHQLQRKLNPNWTKIVDTPAPIKRRIKI